MIFCVIFKRHAMHKFDFGNHLKQVLSRKRGMTISKLAEGINCDPSLISRMCNGERLSTPTARKHILRIIIWLLDQGIIYDLEDANLLLGSADVDLLKTHKAEEIEIINRIKNQTSKSIRRDPLDQNYTLIANHTPNNLPYPFYGTFIGREIEFNKIINLLRLGKESYVYLISIDGIGGIGKSSLALAAGYYFIDSDVKVFDAVIWTSAKEEWLSPAGPIPKPTGVSKTLNEVLCIIAGALNFLSLLEDQNSDLWINIVYQQLKQKSVLLIIDNLETIEDDALISFLYELPPPTKAIITTRQRIDMAYNIRLEELCKEDAFRLIENLSTDIVIEYEQKNLLYKRTGGVPLALVWSMGQLNSGMKVDVLLKKLGSSKIRDIAKYCFEQSVLLIKNDPAYLLLAAISLFESGATRLTVGHVAGLSTDEITRDEGLITLERLSLISRHGNRISMLPLTRE